MPLSRPNTVAMDQHTIELHSLQGSATPLVKMVLGNYTSPAAMNMIMISWSSKEYDYKIQAVKTVYLIIPDPSSSEYHYKDWPVMNMITSQGHTLTTYVYTYSGPWYLHYVPYLCDIIHNQSF